MRTRPYPSPLAERLGGLLQQQRQQHRLTQSEVAERSNLSLKYFGEIERGEANVTLDALERIAAALEWDPWSLFSNEATPISQSVHRLLVVELTGARQRLQAVIDWLLALDPTTPKQSQTAAVDAPGRAKVNRGGRS